MFFFQYFVQAGVFFTIPLFLSVVLELSAFETGLRLVPLSLTLLVAALGVPRLWPNASPRLVVRLGLLAVARRHSSFSSARSTSGPPPRSSRCRCC